MEKILNEQIVSQVKQFFDAQLKHPVQVLFFGRQTGCETCDDTRQLLEEVVAISDKLELSIYDVNENDQIARQYHVDKTPGVVLAAQDGDDLKDYGIRFAGIPSGHEFSTLIHDMILVSGRDSGLQPKTREILKQIDKPVHLQVFVTPT